MNIRKMMLAVLAALVMTAAFAQTSVEEKKLGKMLEKNKDASAVFVSEIDLRQMTVAADGRVTIPLLAKNKIVIVSEMDMTSIAQRIAASRKSKFTATFTTKDAGTKTYALTDIAGLESAGAESTKTNDSNSAKVPLNSIAVPAPKGVNLGDGADWIPLFIQGVITANFQQYSGLTVVDRQNADMVKAEQKLSESAEFDEKNTLELGKMTSARFIVTGNIMAKSNAYALTFSITDAETGETKASASVPNCLRSALEDGTAANQISYDLMTSYGIALGADAKTKLTQTASVMAAEMSAQTSVAKGIAAEKGGSNIEALTYYI